MNILLATEWPIPHLGGVWTSLQQIKAFLESRHHTVDIFGSTPDGRGFHLVGKRRIDVFPEPMQSLRAMTADVPVLRLCGFELARYCLELSAAHLGVDQYDVVHAQDVGSAVGMSRVINPTSALIATLRGYLGGEWERFRMPPSQQAYLWWAERAGASCADATLVPCDWVKGVFVTKFGIPDHRIEVMSNGYHDVSRFLQAVQAPTTMQRPVGKQVILYAGRLAPVKGLGTLVDALARLKAVRSDWVCWLAGDGESRDSLARRADELGLRHHVVFLGARDDIPALLNRADIFVLPSVQEAQSLAVIEAQLAGRAVVVSDAAGLPEMVDHGNTGVMFPAGNADALCGALCGLLENHQQRRDLGARGHSWALTRWSFERSGERLLSIYETCLARRAGSAHAPRKTLAVGPLTVSVPFLYQIPDVTALDAIRSSLGAG